MARVEPFEACPRCWADKKSGWDLASQKCATCEYDRLTDLAAGGHVGGRAAEERARAREVKRRQR